MRQICLEIGTDLQRSTATTSRHPIVEHSRVDSTSKLSALLLAPWALTNQGDNPAGISSLNWHGAESSNPTLQLLILGRGGVRHLPLGHKILLGGTKISNERIHGWLCSKPGTKTQNYLEQGSISQPRESMDEQAVETCSWLLAHGSNMHEVNGRAQSPAPARQLSPCIFFSHMVSCHWPTQAYCATQWNGRYFSFIEIQAGLFFPKTRPYGHTCMSHHMDHKMDKVICCNHIIKTTMLSSHSPKCGARGRKGMILYRLSL